LGTPKQDELIGELVNRVHVPLVAIGAAFDFLAGTKPEAPAWLQGTGLEWIFRLLSEPRRLWRRYLVGNTRFVLGAVKDVARSRFRSKRE
jgi:N-acetylglucosaminyldiphosphoundecaprenol N-acetyl-beta-D-mannosaminyltransferase